MSSRLARVFPVVLALALALLLVGQAAQGKPYTAKEVKWIHQNKYDRATDFHVKFFQEEDNIHVNSWEVGAISGGIGQPGSVKRGDQPEPQHSKYKEMPGIPPDPNRNPDDGSHAVDLDWDNLNVPYCTWIDIPFSWVLSDQNTKFVWWEWTKKDDPVAPKKKGGPKNGWKIHDPVDIGNGQWKHHVIISNLDQPNDPLEPEPMDLYLRNIRYGTLLGLNEITDQDLHDWSAWTNAPITSIVLHPGESLEYDVVTPWKDGHILTGYEAYDPNPVPPEGLQVQSDGYLVEVGDHPTETTPEPQTVVTLVLGCLALLGSRRRK